MWRNILFTVFKRNKKKLIKNEVKYLVGVRPAIGDFYHLFVTVFKYNILI